MAAFGRLVGSARPAGAHDSTTFEFSRLRRCSNCRAAAVYRCPLIGVTPGNLHVVLLLAGEGGTLLTGRGQLF
jgi:hypothetical protein